MSVGQPLRALDFYDVVVNLVPGAVLVLGTGVLVAPAIDFSGLPKGTALIAFVILSFVAGHVMQWMGSELEGTPRLFGDTMKRIRGQENEDLQTDIRLTEVEDEFWELCKEEFNLTDDFTDYGKLMRLLLSRLETSGRRSTRFQALYTFHRSMSATCVCLLVIVILSFTAAYAFISPTPYVPYATVGVLSLFGLLIFQDRVDHFNKLFVEYVIIDFHVENT